jgi:hypothetical protein
MGFLRGLADWFRNNVPVIGPPIADAIEGIERGIEDWSRRLWDAANAVFTFFQAIWISIQLAGARFASLVQDWWWMAYTLFTSLWDRLYGFFSWVWDSFRSWVQDRIYEFLNFLNWVWPGFRDTISRLWDAWTGFVRDPWGTISRAINQIWSAIYDRVKPFLDEINGRINEVRNWFNDRIRDLSNALDNARRQLESRISELGTWARNSLDDINRRFDDFRRNATDWLNNLKRGLEDLTRDFVRQALMATLIYEAGKQAARRRVASEVADVIERPEAQAGLLGGEAAAWLAHPALGAAVTGTVLALEAWSKWQAEQPIQAPMDTDNPLLKLFVRDDEVRFEGVTEFTFGELLAEPPAVEYVWPDVASGDYELKIAGEEALPPKPGRPR